MPFFVLIKFPNYDENFLGGPGILSLCILMLKMTHTLAKLVILLSKFQKPFHLKLFQSRNSPGTCLGGGDLI